MGQIKGVCGQSLSASCTMRKIANRVSIYMCTCALSRRVYVRSVECSQRDTRLSRFWRRKLFAYYVCEFSKSRRARAHRTRRLIFKRAASIPAHVLQMNAAGKSRRAMKSHGMKRTSERTNERAKGDAFSRRGVLSIRQTFQFRINEGLSSGDRKIIPTGSEW